MKKEESDKKNTALVNSSKVNIRMQMNLMVSDPDFRELQNFMGRFNIFRVLGVEQMEIRHSNMLAWLLTPGESHGLGDNFLKSYLMSVSNHAENRLPDAITINTSVFRTVIIQREWRNIDLLIEIQTDDESWVFCIENKIHSKEHDGQLAKYRKIVEEVYPKHRRYYLFLTKYGDSPSDESYIPTSYDLVYKSLSDCVVEYKNALGEEPKVLILNYLMLLKEKLMDDSELAILAEKIYKSYRPVLDVIFENRPQIQDDIYVYLKNKLEQTDDYIVLKSTKTYLNFIPIEWNVSSGINPFSPEFKEPFVIFQVRCKGANQPNLKIVTSHAPYAWVSRVLIDLDQENSKLKEDQIYKTVWSTTKKSLKYYGDEGQVTENIEEKVWNWLKDTLRNEKVKKHVDIIKDHILGIHN